MRRGALIYLVLAHSSVAQYVLTDSQTTLCPKKRANFGKL